MLIVKDEYIRLLNRNYCVTAHLSERLDELRGLNVTAGFAEAIETVTTALEKQLENIGGYYQALQISFSFSDTTALASYLECLFSYVHSAEGITSPFALLDYITFANLVLKETAALAALPASAIQNLKLPDQPLYNEETLKQLVTLLKNVSVKVPKQ